MSVFECTLKGVLLLLGLTVTALAEDVGYFQTDERYTYRTELLTLILDKTIATHGEYNLRPIKDKITYKRGVDLLKKGEFIDVASFPTDANYEHNFKAIKIPILRGLLGYRLLLVRKGNSDLFKDVDSIEQLSQQYMAGFNGHWGDIKILKANNIDVFESPYYKNLFLMLARGRFHYFPRGINEIYNELKLHPELAIESNLAFYYPYYVYFFVRKDNDELAARLEQGLKLAIRSGEFDALFKKHHEKIIKLTQPSTRRTLILNNPFVPNDKSIQSEYFNVLPFLGQGSSTRMQPKITVEPI